MAAVSSLCFFASVAALLLMLISCDPTSLPEEGLKKQDWVRVGQCMLLYCKQTDTTCFRYCVTSVQQRLLPDHIEVTWGIVWTLPEPGIKINFDEKENNVVYPYPCKIEESAFCGTPSDESFVFLLLGEGPGPEMWYVKGWSTNTSMTIGYEYSFSHTFLAIATEGLLVEENTITYEHPYLLEIAKILITVYGFGLCCCLVCLCFRREDQPEENKENANHS